MSITVFSLYNDSFNFIRNKSKSFFSIALLVTLIYLLLSHFFSITPADLQAIDSKYQTNIAELTFSPNAMGSEQQVNNLLNELESLPSETFSALSADFMPLLFKEFAPALLVPILLTTWAMTFILSVVNGQQYSFSEVMSHSLPLLPRMILLSLVSGMIVVIGLNFLLVPGLFFYFAFTLAPIILMTRNYGVFASLSASMKFFLRYPGAVSSGVFFSIAMAMFNWFVLASLFSVINIPILTLFLLQLINCMIAIFFMLYFYRLYTSVKLP